MSKTVKSKLNPFITEVAGSADSILKDNKKLKKLIRAASRKIASTGKKIKPLRKDLSTLLDLIKAWARGSYKDIPWNTLLLSTGAVVYFVNPFDAIPDILPAAGFLDDATVIGLVLASAKEDIKRFRRWQRWQMIWG